MAQESTRTASNVAGTAASDIPTNQASNIFENVVEGAVSKPLRHAEARTVYGEPVTHGDRMVIPVAKVSSGYGFGGGQGTNDKSEQQGGGGGGGKLDVTPIGYVEITSGKSQFMPIVDASAIALRVVTLFGIAVIIGVLAATRGGNGDD